MFLILGCAAISMFDILTHRYKCLLIFIYYGCLACFSKKSTFSPSPTTRGLVLVILRTRPLVIMVPLPNVSHSAQIMVTSCSCTLSWDTVLPLLAQYAPDEVINVRAIFHCRFVLVCHCRKCSHIRDSGKFQKGRLLRAVVAHL